MAAESNLPPRSVVERLRGRRLIVWRLAATALAGWALLHFSLVLLTQLPLGGIPTGVRAAAGAYVVPLFVQGWALFAPDPPRLERTADARGVYQQAGERRATDWLPLTEPLERAVQGNRWSSHNEMWQVVGHAVHSLTAETPLLRVGPETRARLLAELVDEDRKPTGLIVLERSAAAALVSTYPDLRFVWVQVRIRARAMPSPSEPDSTAERPSDELLFPEAPFPDVARWSAPR